MLLVLVTFSHLLHAIKFSSPFVHAFSHPLFLDTSAVAATILHYKWTSVMGTPHVNRSALLLVQEGIAFNHNLCFFSRSLSSRVSASVRLSPLSSTSLPQDCCPRHSHCHLVSQSLLFLCTVPPHVFPLDDNSILAVSSLSRLSASSFSHHCGNLGPRNGKRRTHCKFRAAS